MQANGACRDIHVYWFRSFGGSELLFTARTAASVPPTLKRFVSGQHGSRGQRMNRMLCGPLAFCLGYCVMALNLLTVLRRLQETSGRLVQRSSWWLIMFFFLVFCVFLLISINLSLVRQSDFLFRLTQSGTEFCVINSACCAEQPPSRGAIGRGGGGWVGYRWRNPAEINRKCLLKLSLSSTLYTFLQVRAHLSGRQDRRLGFVLCLTADLCRSLEDSLLFRQTLKDKRSSYSRPPLGCRHLRPVCEIHTDWC